MTKVIKISDDVHNLFFVWCKIANRKMKDVTEELIMKQISENNNFKNKYFSLEIKPKQKLTKKLG